MLNSRYSSSTYLAMLRLEPGWKRRRPVVSQRMRKRVREARDLEGTPRVKKICWPSWDHSAWRLKLSEGPRITRR